MTWEPLGNIIAGAPYSCTFYAKKFDLLNTRMETAHEACQNSKGAHQNPQEIQVQTSQDNKEYKHGWEVPQDYAHALQLDVQNGNT